MDATPYYPGIDATPQNAAMVPPQYPDVLDPGSVPEQGMMHPSQMHPGMIPPEWAGSVAGADEARRRGSVESRGGQVTGVQRQESEAMVATAGGAARDASEGKTDSAWDGGEPPAEWLPTLCRASRDGDERLVQLMLATPHATTSLDTPHLLEDEDADEFLDEAVLCPLHYAAQHGWVGIVAHGAEVGRADEEEDEVEQHAQTPIPAPCHEEQQHGGGSRRSSGARDHCHSRRSSVRLSREVRRRGAQGGVTSGPVQPRQC